MSVPLWLMRPVVDGSADMLIYCPSLSNALDLDVSSALGKLQTNEHRCPAHPGGCERRAPDPTAGRLLSPAAAGKGLLDRVRFSAGRAWFSPCTGSENGVQ